MQEITSIGLHGKSLLRLADITDEQMLGLVKAAIALKARKKAGLHLQNPLIKGKNIALVFHGECSPGRRRKCRISGSIRHTLRQKRVGQGFSQSAWTHV